jgi:hypothetical protein
MSEFLKMNRVQYQFDQSFISIYHIHNITIKIRDDIKIIHIVIANFLIKIL